MGLKTAGSHSIIKYTLTTYCNKTSVDNTQEPATFCQGLGNCANLNFGDGESAVQKAYTSKTDIGNNTYKIEFDFEYTYTADGKFNTSFFDENRSKGILNLFSPSDLLSFYVNNF